MDPLGMISAMHAVERHVSSARPDAPVIKERGSFIDPARDATARALRRLADRLEPPARRCPAPRLSS